MASLSEQMGLDWLATLSAKQIIWLCTILVSVILINLAFFRLSTILSRTPAKRPDPSGSPTHLLVVLGSGGHTAEMLNILSSLGDLHLAYTSRTYICSSGDSFSASKAAEFEKTLGGEYNIITVRRARRVHQTTYTAPFTTVLCFFDCFKLLKIEPDLILTNGPGTGVCVVLAAVLRLFLGGQGMRSIFIESWARVKSLSLSGRILKPFVDRFIVQWPDLVKAEGDRVEYIGPLVS